MYLCILDEEGKTVFQRNCKATPEAFLRAIAPSREDIVVAVEVSVRYFPGGLF
jgi:hypothetical protein